MPTQLVARFALTSLNPHVDSSDDADVEHKEIYSSTAHSKILPGGRREREWRNDIRHGRADLPIRFAKCSAGENIHFFPSCRLCKNFSFINSNRSDLAVALVMLCVPAY